MAASPIEFFLNARTHIHLNGDAFLFVAIFRALVVVVAIRSEGTAGRLSILVVESLMPRSVARVFQTLLLAIGKKRPREEEEGRPCASLSNFFLFLPERPKWIQRGPPAVSLSSLSRV
jgi:hypothetical protein